MNEVYGLTGWIPGTITYSDEYPGATVTDTTRSATRTATFVGTLAEAVQSAPELGSKTDALSDDLRLHKRTFTEDKGTVTLTMTYAIFSNTDESGDEESEPTYSLASSPGNVSILSAERFKDEPATAREIARMYVNGNTDATVVYYKEDESVLYDKRPEKPSDPAEAAKWKWSTLCKLGEKFAKDSTLVKYARAGKKTLPNNGFTWTEVSTAKSLPSLSRLGGTSTPRGPQPGGFKWMLSNITATQKGTDAYGNRVWTITRVWTTVKDGEEPERGGTA